VANAEFIEEVGGGLNLKRPKFVAIMDRIEAREVSQLIVAHEDRWVRFGFPWILALPSPTSSGTPGSPASNANSVIRNSKRSDPAWPRTRRFTGLRIPAPALVQGRDAWRAHHDCRSVLPVNANLFVVRLPHGPETARGHACRTVALQ
jgi:hypothetical protein